MKRPATKTTTTTTCAAEVETVPELWRAHQHEFQPQFAAQKRWVREPEPQAIPTEAQQTCSFAEAGEFHFANGLLRESDYLPWHSFALQKIAQRDARLLLALHVFTCTTLVCARNYFVARDAKTPNLWLNIDVRARKARRTCELHSHCHRLMDLRVLGCLPCSAMLVRSTTGAQEGWAKLGRVAWRSARSQHALRRLGGQRQARERRFQTTEPKHPKTCLCQPLQLSSSCAFAFCLV